MNFLKSRFIFKPSGGISLRLPRLLGETAATLSVPGRDPVAAPASVMKRALKVIEDREGT
jgi:hypothetical protein